MTRLSRRQWLVGLGGATLALPALQAFSAPTPQRWPRLLVYFLPNGRRPEWWLPTHNGHALVFKPQCAALQPFADRALSLVELSNNAARYSAGAPHAKGTGTVLTATALSDLTVATNHISIDQAVAEAWSDITRFS